MWGVMINMENKTKLTIGMIITLVLAVSGTYYLSQDDDAYYCEAKDMVMICEKLSSGIGTRCYFNETYKICRDGWIKVEVGQELNQSEIEYGKGIRWECSPESCIQIE